MDWRQERGLASDWRQQWILELIQILADWRAVSAVTAPTVRPSPGQRFQVFLMSPVEYIDKARVEDSASSIHLKVIWKGGAMITFYII